MVGPKHSGGDLPCNCHPDQIVQMIRTRGKFLVLDFRFYFTPFPHWQVPERQLMTSLTAGASIGLTGQKFFSFLLLLPNGWRCWRRVSIHGTKMKKEEQQEDQSYQWLLENWKLIVISKDQIGLSHFSTSSLPNFNYFSFRTVSQSFKLNRKCCLSTSDS